MSKKEHTYAKLEAVTELVRKEATSLLDDLKSLGDLLGLNQDTPLIAVLEYTPKSKNSPGVDQEKAAAILERLYKKVSFNEYENWLEALIRHSLSKVQDRLGELIKKLEDEFPISDIHDATDDIKGLHARLNAHVIIKTDLLSSLVLFTLDMNGPAFIELHSVLERQAIDKLDELISMPSNIKARLGIPERYRLQELASMLKDYEILDEKDVEFARQLSTLRDGLAHRNINKVSNAVFSGKSLDDIDFAASGVDYISFAIRAIHFLMKIQEEHSAAN